MNRHAEFISDLSRTRFGNLLNDGKQMLHKSCN